MNKVVDIIKKLASPIVEANGLELWDVEYIKEAGSWYLRVFIDSPDGVSINQCENVSRKLEEKIDEIDPIEGSYIFEVSSAGADRQLKRPEDFDRYMGSLVEVKLYKAKDGKKDYTGELCSYKDGNIEIKAEDKTFSFEKNDIALVRLYVEF